MANSVVKHLDMLTYGTSLQETYTLMEKEREKKETHVHKISSIMEKNWWHGFFPGKTGKLILILTHTR